MRYCTGQLSDTRTAVNHPFVQKSLDTIIAPYRTRKEQVFPKLLKIFYNTISKILLSIMGQQLEFDFSLSLVVEVCCKKTIRSTTGTSESSICRYLNAHEHYVPIIKTTRCLRHDYLSRVITLTKFLEHLQNNMSNFERNFEKTSI